MRVYGHVSPCQQKGWGWITGVTQPLSHCGGGQRAEAGNWSALALSPRDGFVHPLVWQLFTLLFRTGLRSPHIHHWHENTGYPCLSTPPPHTHTIWPVRALHCSYTLMGIGRTRWANQMVVSQVPLLDEANYTQSRFGGRHTLSVHSFKS